MMQILQFKFGFAAIVSSRCHSPQAQEHSLRVAKKEVVVEAVSMDFKKAIMKEKDGAEESVGHGDSGSPSFPSNLSAQTSGIVSQELAKEILSEALTWASLHGLVMGDRSVENSGNVPGVGLAHAPISLLPSPFPEEQFRQATEMAPIFNELYDRVSMDGKFLQEALSRAQKVDTFTAKLLEIHLKVMQDGVKQSVRLGLHRSDYMADMKTGDLLQIEMNTISSSFAGLGSQVSKLHRYLIGYIQKHSHLQYKRVPESNAIDGFAKALALAFKEFGDPSAVVLMVVQPEERNMYDQGWLTVRLYELFEIVMIRRTLAEVHSEGTLHPDGSLIIDNQTVAIVYYRAGYSPNDYLSEKEWGARAAIEQSRAIKCPSIAYHLAGTKKIQQELAKPGVLERFMEDADAMLKLRRCFAGLWALDDDTDLAIIDKAIQNPDAYVMKPQREGGGNNLYGEDIGKKLKELKEENVKDSLSAYILMQRIFPPIHTTYVVRGGMLIAQKAISELGIFSAYVRNNNKVIINEHTGYLLRTKSSTTNEGGVATGFSVLDSVYLLEGSLK